MDDATFWDLIGRLDWRDEDDDDAIVEPLVRSLALLPDAEIGSFQEILAQKLYELDGRPWGRESGDEVWFGDPDRVSRRSVAVG